MTSKFNSANLVQIKKAPLPFNIPFTDSSPLPFTNSSPLPFTDSSPFPFTDSSPLPFPDSSPLPFTDSSPLPFTDSSPPPAPDVVTSGCSKINKDLSNKKTNIGTMLKQSISEMQFVKLLSSLDKMSLLKNQKHWNQRCPMMILKQILLVYDMDTITTHYKSIEQWLDDVLYKAPESMQLAWARMSALVETMSEQLAEKKQKLVMAIIHGLIPCASFPHVLSTTPSLPPEETTAASDSFPDDNEHYLQPFQHIITCLANF
jgi:hypothetical protein